jgi:4-amino-4-deoxy-L-arabinose transferase-like glycosyltransferase
MDNLENKSISKKSKVLTSVCVLLLAAIMASWAISAPGMENHECYVSITAREMLESGDWVMPTYNGQPRLQKTPLSYWLVAGFAKISGQVDEFTARLPSAILAVLSVAAILYFVNHWLSFRVAIMSALIWATSLSYIKYAHNARPEMALTLFIVLCFLSFYSAVIASSRRNQVIYMLIFWVSFGLANLAKGPAPLPLVLIPLFFYITVFRRWKMIPKLLPIVGVIIFLAIVLPWPLAIGQRVNWDLVIWKQHFFDRFFGKFASGNYPFYFYLPFIFAFVAPWVAFVPAALTSPFYSIWGKKQKAMWFLWLWFIADLVFLTISGGKRKHYILPAMPAVAILIGIILEDMTFVRRAFTKRFAKNFLLYHMLFIAIFTVAGMVYMVTAHPEFLFETLTISTIGLAMVGGITLSFVRRKAALACCFLFGGYCILAMCYLSFSAPLDNNNYTREFALAVLEKVPRTDKLVAYSYVSPRVVHYFGRPILEIEEKSLLYQHYDRGQWVIATDQELKELEQDGRLRKVYYNENAEMHSDRNVRGALFHKPARPAGGSAGKVKNI